MTTPSRGRRSSSGLKWLISFALPFLATRSWLITAPAWRVIAASRWTFFFPAARRHAWLR